MSPLFRKDPEKAAARARAQEEIKRLRALDTAEVAALLLPALGPDGVSQGYSVRPQQLCDYLVRDFPGARQFDALDLLIPVRKALLKLDEAELVYPISHQRTPVWRLTPLGEEVLAAGTLEQHIGPGK